MKKLLLLLSMLSFSTVYAAPLSSYADVKNAVTSGKNIHIVVDFNQCADRQDADMQITGVFSPKSLLIVNEHIATSSRHFTLNHPRFKDQPVFEYIRYTFNENDELVLQATTLDARNQEILKKGHPVRCKIGQGVSVYS